MSSHWLPGNTLTLLENGEAYYPRVFALIAAAEREVLLETFILFDDKVGQGLRQALLQAAGQGAEVHLLIDGWGSPDLSPEFTQPLLDAGVKVRSYEPVQRLFGARVNMLRRMHRKLLVVDGRHAFVGGINYSIDHLAEHGPLSKQDYAVEIQGPLVAHIQAFCRASIDVAEPARRQWLQYWRTRLQRSRRQGSQDRVERSTRKGALAAFVTRDNRTQRTDIEDEYRLAIRSARKRVLIANAYFYPGFRLLREFRRAARRGVQVDLVLQGRPDLFWVKRAGELLYRHLIRSGVCVYEYTERPLHAKVAVIDDEWATVGSSNLDPTSLSLNQEANVFVRDAEFACTVRESIERLRDQNSLRIELPVPGRLASFWIGLRSAIVFHASRRLWRWAARAPARAPRVVSVKGMDAGEKPRDEEGVDPRMEEIPR